MANNADGKWVDKGINLVQSHFVQVKIGLSSRVSLGFLVRKLYTVPCIPSMGMCLLGAGCRSWWWFFVTYFFGLCPLWTEAAHGLTGSSPSVHILALLLSCAQTAGMIYMVGYGCFRHDKEEWRYQSDSDHLPCSPVAICALLILTFWPPTGCSFDPSEKSIFVVILELAMTVYYGVGVHKEVLEWKSWVPWTSMSWMQ